MKMRLILFCLILWQAFFNAQTTAYGYIKDDHGKAIEWAEVDLKESVQDVTADKIGYFQFVNLKPGNYQIVIYKGNYETKVVNFEIKGHQKKQDLGVIILDSSIHNLEQGFTLLDNESHEDPSAQTTIGLLQSSPDVFNRIAAYDLGFYWFKPRGSDGRYGEIMFNGTSMKRPDDGSIDFSHWGGLNEITRYPEMFPNHTPSEYSFGGINSIFYKNTNAGEYRKGHQLTYSLTNRNYHHRLTYRFSTGMSRKGWAFTTLFARRWAKEGLQEGTFYNSYGGYLGIEKKINDHHTLTLNAIIAPYMRALTSPNTQEVYDYRGTYYNSYWGWQNGNMRNERIRSGMQPIIQLTDYWKISNKTRLWTTLSYQWGKDKSSRLDWQGVPNPSPTYFRKLPSYFSDSLIHAKVLQDWTSNQPSVTQIDWDSFYQKNQSQNPDTYYGSKGKKALYYQVNDVSDDRIFNANTHFGHEFTKNSKIFINIGYQNYQSNLYREVQDLLGADFALNKDPFSTRISSSLSGLYNEGEENVTKKVGDRIGYDYLLKHQQWSLNPSYQMKQGRFSLMVSGLVKYSESSRKGNFKHYSYENSYGESPKVQFWNFGMKGQITYAMNGRNHWVYNGAHYSQAPYLQDIFFNPRNNANVSPLLNSTIINANDLSYVVSTPYLKARLTGYWITSKNTMQMSRYFADVLQIKNADANESIVTSSFVTEMMPNVDLHNKGGELGVEVKITSGLALQGLASIGSYQYKNNPDLYIGSDVLNENGKNFAYIGKAYLENYRQGGTPQTAFSLGMKYNHPKFWWIGANWNYFDKAFLAPAAYLRTENFVQNPVSGVPFSNVTDEELQRVLTQNQLPSSFFINANAGKSWVLGKLYVLISLSVNNVLNNKKFITGGFEQVRETSYRDFVSDFDKSYPNFAPKYWYSQGRSYFLNVQLRF